MWRIAGINFDHFHMGDLLRMARDHPGAEVVGISDEQPGRTDEAARACGLPGDKVFADHRECLEKTAPDLVILCPAAARHAEWTEKVAPFGVHVIMEKPFAATLAEADRMIAAMSAAGKQLTINWPLAWHRSHAKCREVIEEGTIGEVREIHFYDGNRGPLWHGADKVEREPTDAEKAASWFYRAAEGGGSMQDYLGYGTTLGTWFNGGRKPIEVMAMWDLPGNELEVDEHSITVARYESGLSKFETRWGTFSDPWTHQPQPKCGFVVKGVAGSVSSYDYDDFVTVQTAECPEGRRVEAPELAHPNSNPVAYVLDCLENDRPIEGPLSVEISRVGQQIVDTAIESAKQGRALPLVGG
ncbi:MAG: Gfo/Idh/MocA family oxidoreductase [Verrucomicrobiales bacterium]